MRRSTSEPAASEAWDVRLDPVVGAEQGGTRRALVISSAVFNSIQKYLHFVVPITGTDRGLEFQIRIRGRKGGLSKNAALMSDRARTVSVQRFRAQRGEVSPICFARCSSWWAG